jgi:hypothetical protein
MQPGERKERREQGMRKEAKSKMKKCNPRHIWKIKHKIKGTKEG